MKKHALKESSSGLKIFLSLSVLLHYSLQVYSLSYFSTSPVVATRRPKTFLHSSRLPLSTKNEKKRTKSDPICKRITSCEASQLIRNFYRTNKEDDDDGDLLIITSDASRGANRHIGLATVLREISVHSEKIEKNFDIVTATARRIRSLEARDIYQSEVAALALGIKTALQNVPIQNRKRVLILTDSNSAMSFFCGDKEGIKNPNSNHLHYRAMQTLLHDADETCMAKVKSAKLGVDGFFDHDVTDVLSSFAKAVSNKDLQKLQCSKPQYCNETPHKLECTAYPVLIIRAPCNRLREEDLDYLKHSANIGHIGKMAIRKSQILMKKESGERLQRCRRRMEQEFGIKLNK